MFLTGEFMPREGQSLGSLSSRGVLGDSWPGRPLQVKAEARSETRPDHGGAPHKANLPSWTQWLQKRPIRQRCPRQQARPPCVKTFSECLPASRQGPCESRSRAIFGRPCKPTSRKFRWRPARAPPPANPATKFAENLRDASDASSTLSIEVTLNTGSP